MKYALFRIVSFVAFAGAAASTAAAQHPRLLKRQGIVYGVLGVDFMSNCKGAGAFDQSEVYQVSGTVESVGYYMKTHLISNFTLRTRGGRREVQNVDPWDFPKGAYGLIQPGRRVRVRGILTGMGRIASADEIILDRHP